MLLFALLWLTLVGEVAYDLNTALGISDSVWYCLPLFLSSFVGRRYFSLQLAGLITVLLVLGFWLSPAGTNPQYALAARAVIDVALWLMALLIYRQKTTDAARRQSLEALEFQGFMLGYLREGVYLLKASDLTIIYANPSLERMFGYAAQELIGQQVSILNAPTENTKTDKAQEILQSLSRNGSWSGEIQNIKKDGTVFWSYATAVPCQHPEHGQVYLSSHFDVTERKRTEAALVKSEARFRTYLHQAGEAFYAHDLEGRILDVNTVTCAISGYTRDELMQLTVFDLEQDFSPKQAKQTWQSLAPGQIVTVFGQHRRKDGNVFPIEAVIRREEWQGQSLILVLARDITERLRQENELQKLTRLYAAASEINQTIVQVSSREQLFSEICRILVDSGGFAMAWVGWLDPDSKMVNFAARHGDRGGYLDDLIISAANRPEGYGPTGVSIREERACTCNDIANDALMQPWREKAGCHGFASSLSVPIRLDGNVAGALVVYAGQKDYFGRSEIVLLEASARDISIGLDQLAHEQKRQKTEEILRESQSRFQTILKTTMDGFWCVDRQGYIQEVNSSYCHMSGYTEAELIGQNISLVKATHSFLDTPAHLQEIATLGQSRYETVHRHKDGHAIQLEVSAQYLAEKDRQVIYAFLRDITERKIAEEASQRLIVAIDQSAESIIFTDRKGRILYVNQGFEQCSGYLRTEVIGKSVNLLKSGEHPPEFYQELWQTISQGIIWRGKFINRRKNGELYDDKSIISPVRNRQGEITSYVAVNHDVTREESLQKQLIQAQKMEVVGQLAGGVAHDFNNILAALSIQLELLNMEPDLTADLKKSLAPLETGINRAIQLTRQLLTFSRRQTMQVQVIDLHQVMAEQLKLLKRLLGEHIELDIHPPVGNTRIQADPGMMEQVIMNLCINARDAMPNGGKLTVRVQDVQIEENFEGNSRAARAGDFVCLTVTDTGSGMSQETQKRLFEPFFTTKEVGKGTGLGLATIYGIVQQHHGWVEVNSELGKGSEFRVYVPATAMAAKERTTAAKRALVSGQANILVVEDEEPVREAVVKCLKLAGYDVLAATNGPEALTNWSDRAKTIDLLCTDVVMPGGMTGWELAEAFRKIHPDMGVIVTSGYNTKLPTEAELAKQRITFLPKPTSGSQLTEAIHKTLAELRSGPKVQI